MKPRIAYPLTVIATALALTGCAIGPDYVRPATPLPASYAEATGSEQAAVNARWWTLFGDATLDQLVDKALQNNADLRQAISRVEQADALAREAGASFFPEITGNAGGSNTQASTKTAIYNSALPRIRNSRSASLSTSYELDLWGRVRRANEAAKASQLATAYARDSVRLSVAGLVTATYLGLRAADAQLQMTGATLKSREESLKLVRTRIDAGLSAPVDGHQAATAVAAAQAQQADLTRQRALAEHQLALLSGDPALKIAAGDLRALPLPPQPPVGLPADLVAARPDIRQAEQELIAANAGIGIAKAGYFPRLSLTASLGSESKALSDLFSAGSGTWALGLGALMPILDFGRTSARVDQAKAVNQQSLITWQNALAVAYKEVRDALVSLREDATADTAQQTRLENAAQVLAIVEKRYAAGHAGYLEVLDAQRSHNDAAIAAIAARQARLIASVDLFKALGGGWQPESGKSAGS